MKKPLLAVLLPILLIGSFLGGIWYNQNGAGKNLDAQGGRRILHYVDPMNPAHTSDKAGIAPCGMPMEPVYDEEAGFPGAVLSISPDTVKITPQKQQIIGVRVGAVEAVSETHGVRTLGRIVPDEHRVYPLIAATDGWMHDVHGNTTGSMVKKDQVLARIKIYSYDFFTWQQRYLAELGKRGRQRPSAASSAGARQPGAKRAGVIQTGMPQDGTPQPEDMPPEIMQPDEMPPSATQPDGAPPMPMQPGGMPPGAPRRGARQQEAPQIGARQPEAMKPVDTQALTELSIADPLSIRVDDVLYANKSKLELLNLGAGEAQLEDLAQTGRYVTHIELRSPVTGLVVARNVSPQQKIDRGTECFRIADLSRVWIAADVYNVEAQYIQPGMRARISLPQQNRSFEATVSDVLPQFDAATRTLKVRLEADNLEYVLRPDMFVDVEFLITLPPAITVPVDAILESGLRKTVFVALGNGLFEPRTVQTGWRFGDRVEIVEGLMPGEPIVISGNFLIDSESRMKLAAAGLYGIPETDPVCGRNVYASWAKAAGLTSEYQGKAYYFCSGECQRQFSETSSSRAEGAENGATVDDVKSKLGGLSKDPICGMFIRTSKSKDEGLVADYEGKTFYFHNKETKKLFERAPAHYAERAARKEANPGIASPPVQQAPPVPKPKDGAVSPGPLQTAPPGQEVQQTTSPPGKKDGCTPPEANGDAMSHMVAPRTVPTGPEAHDMDSDPDL
jgi:YHS domain-containing protein